MRLTLSEGDVVFVTNNCIPNKRGWLFGIQLTADNSLAEVGLVHQTDIARVSKDEMSRWPAILDRPIPSSVSSVLFLGGRTGKIHFGIPARIAFRRTGNTPVRVRGEVARYLDVEVGEIILLVGYANDNYYAIKAGYDEQERVWSGLVDHNDVVLLRPVGSNEDREAVVYQEPPPFGIEDANHADLTSTLDVEPRAGDHVGMEGCLEDSCRKVIKRLSPFNLRIMKWRSQVYADSYSRRLTIVN
ncbi:hypothetical protein L218DRAFT_998905 [Marasmius fiardii PR-910]|nr:hypothetical protein L218DRAFT_998905 [Marasmius fiardii PR-910]